MSTGCNEAQKANIVQKDFAGYLSKKSCTHKHFVTCPRRGVAKRGLWGMPHPLKSCLLETVGTATVEVLSAKFYYLHFSIYTRSHEMESILSIKVNFRASSSYILRPN